MILLHFFSLLVLIGTLFYTSVLDIKYRKVEFENWYPLMIIGTISLVFQIITQPLVFTRMSVIITITVVVVFWLCGYFKLYGGADAWALMLITIFSLTIPFSSMLNNISNSYGVSTYINAFIIYAICYPARKIFEDHRGIPFIVYIIFGFLFAIFIGDIYNFVIGVIL
jgi:prepilin signal peptidase PulO-like enzyme (type II secretory pathway)